MLHRPAYRTKPLIAGSTGVGVVMGWALGSPASAQAPPAPRPQGDPSQVIFWCIVLIAAAFVLGLAFYLIRKRLMREDDAPTAGLSMGFTLADLRAMHAQGQLSDEEYDYAKRKMAAKARAEMVSETTDDDEPEILHLGEDDPPPPEAGR